MLGQVGSRVRVINFLQTTGAEELGLDPFQILEPQDAADILGEITHAPDTTRIQFHKYSDKVKSLKEFHDVLPKKKTGHTLII